MGAKSARRVNTKPSWQKLKETARAKASYQVRAFYLKKQQLTKRQIKPFKLEWTLFCEGFNAAVYQSIISANKISLFPRLFKRLSPVECREPGINESNLHRITPHR
jgi:hypothetical protein